MPAWIPKQAHIGIRSLLCLVLLSGAAFAQVALPPPGIPADEIVSKMALRNQQRARDLASYTGIRKYHLDYNGFPGKRSADMEVRVVFTAPASKEFTVVSQSGSKLVLNRVFKRLLESEREAQDEENRRRTALTPDNYNFTLRGDDIVQGRTAYVLNVEPKVDNKFLYRGTIWVDAIDFAVIKIEAEPAKNPSFWISKTTIAHSYLKAGEFWLPAHNTSVTKVRLGGTATLTIDYLDYRIAPRATSAAGN